MNLAYNLERSTYFFPDRPAVRQDGLELTYKQLNEQSNRIAAGLVPDGCQAGGFYRSYVRPTQRIGSAFISECSRPGPWPLPFPAC